MVAIMLKRESQHYSVVFASGATVWAVAAGLVLMADQRLAHVSPGACLAAKVMIIITSALVCVRWGAGDATLERALFTGIGWAVLSIIAEMIVVSNFSQTWHPLIGSPAQPGYRDVLLLTWVGAPAMFTRSLS